MPPIDFVTVWNERVPGAPADPSLWAVSRQVNPKAYSDPEFISRFDEICAKAAALVDAGAAWLTFSALVRLERDTGIYKWQRLLTGDYDFVLHKQKRENPKTGVDLAGLADRIRKGIKR